MEMKKTITITGANGFLGSNTIRVAISRGWTVHAIVRRDEVADDVRNLGAIPHILPVLSKEELLPIIKSSSAILNFIGIISTNQGSFDEINVKNMQIILDAASELKNFRVIAPTGLGVDEYGKKVWATNDYFRSKLMIEKICAQSTVDYVLFRPSYILGPGDEMLPSMVEQLIEGAYSIIGKGIAPMQPTYVVDAADAFLNAADGKGPSRIIYDLVGPETINMNDLVKLVEELLRKNKILKCEPFIGHISHNEATHEYDMADEVISIMECDSIGDNSRIIKELGIQFSPLNVAIQSVIDSMIKNEDLIHDIVHDNNHGG
jgi:NADH dehydrogenase